MTNKSEIIDGIQYKQCGTCKQLKPVSGGFYKMAHGNFGVTAECRACGNKRAIEHRRAHPEYMINRYKNDPEVREKVKQWSREWKKKHPEYQKSWVEKHPDYQTNRYKNDPAYREMKKRNTRKWFKAHPDYHKKRREMKLA